MNHSHAVNIATGSHLVLCFITFRQSQIIVLNGEVQVGENELILQQHRVQDWVTCCAKLKEHMLHQTAPTLIIVQITLVISSPSSSTTGLATLILAPVDMSRIPVWGTDSVILRTRSTHAVHTIINSRIYQAQNPEQPVPAPYDSTILIDSSCDGVCLLFYVWFTLHGTDHLYELLAAFGKMSRQPECTETPQQGNVATPKTLNTSLYIFVEPRYLIRRPQRTRVECLIQSAVRLPTNQTSDPLQQLGEGLSEQEQRVTSLILRSNRPSTAQLGCPCTRSLEMSLNEHQPKSSQQLQETFITR